MHRCFVAASFAALMTSLMTSASAADCGCAGGRRGDCEASVPACRSTWDEKKTRKPSYSLKCEYACGRAAESWCRGGDCRCSPPCGSVYVKKKLYKQPGEEKVEKVPKYEVEMVPAEPCDCPRCCGVCWWNPLSVLHYLLGH